MANNWELDHLGYVVRDIDKAYEYYQRMGLELIANLRKN